MLNDLLVDNRVQVNNVWVVRHVYGNNDVVVGDFDSQEIRVEWIGLMPFNLSGALHLTGKNGLRIFNLSP